MKLKLSLIALLATQIITAQTVDTTDFVDYSKFSDAEKVVRYCTPKIINQTPQKIWSVGAEYQTGFNMPLTNSSSSISNNESINNVFGWRANVNLPVVSKDKLIWQAGANIYNQKFNSNTISSSAISNIASNSFTSIGLNTTVFKPLDEDNFIIAQAQIDANGLGLFNKEVVLTKAITASGSVIYGWKKNDNNMFGFGVSRTYRAGRLLYVPVILWNKNFNSKWGMEILLPARGHIKYKSNTKNIFQFGYELEGNQFLSATNSTNIFYQRGELKPRVMWDKQIGQFYWLNVQLGYRINSRFEATNSYDGDKENVIFKSQLGNPFYLAFNFSFATP